MPRKKGPVRVERNALYIGFDGGTHNLAAAAKLFDKNLNRVKTVVVPWRWSNDRPFLEIVKQLADAEEFIFALYSLFAPPSLEREDVFIAIEEPWPVAMVGRAQSSRLKQQAQASGAFIGGLLARGFNIVEVNNMTWKSVVKEDGYPMPRKNVDAKWVTKQWAQEKWGAPDMPDLIRDAHGLVPKPETSRAKPVQPNDVYDAAGICEWLYRRVAR